MRKMIKAVITGDIIHSSRLSSETKAWLFSSIETYLKALKKEYGIKYEMYRGDSFQCLVHNPEDALNVALLIKTFIRSLNPSELYAVTKKSDTQQVRDTVLTTFIFDARIALGIGEVDAENKRLANSDGMAFFLSGHLLDEIKNTNRHFAIDSEDSYQKEWETESTLLDAIIRKTTALQCRVLNYKLQDLTETEIANKLNIGQSAVNQRANSGNWNAIDAMVYRFESAYKKNTKA
jgi:predicted DNA-binding protein YlxM (UPF0122 family)